MCITNQLIEPDHHDGEAAAYFQLCMTTNGKYTSSPAPLNYLKMMKKEDKVALLRPLQFLLRRERTFGASDDDGNGLNV